jgi:uncharacterized protein DUF6544
MSLPPLVRRYLERALPDGAGDVERVDLTQEGTIWMRPDTRGMRFTAREHLEVGRVAFSWRARFPMGLRVVDAYDRGRGLLELRLFGVRVQRQRGHELDVGEALRYLAELPWVPHALERNRELEWREIGERAIEVATQVAGERAAVAFEFDHDGDIVRASALRRRQAGKNLWEKTPWGGEFGEYEVLGGVRIPVAAEVHWEIDGDRFVYWRGRVTSVNAR